MSKMKLLFYHCYGGAHTSITCASIHLNYLPYDRIPEIYEFKAIPFYDKMDNKNLGTPVYMGQDDMGWNIYVVGMKDGKDVVIPAINSYLNTSGISLREILFISALVKLHPITAIGGIISRRLGMAFAGRPMTIWGIRRSYPILVDLVTRVKRDVAAKNDYY
jgi:hypothetical protein